MTTEHRYADIFDAVTSLDGNFLADRNRNKAEIWLHINREIIAFLNEFPNWDRNTIIAIADLYNNKVKELLAEGMPKAAEQFAMRWRSWIAEAAVQRIFKNLKIELRESVALDQNGVDFMQVEHNLESGMSHYIYFQVKSRSHVKAGVFVFETLGALESDKIRTNIQVGDFLTSEKLQDTQPGGRTHKFCHDMSARMWQKMKAKVKQATGSDLPPSHEAYVYFGAIGVGMYVKGRDNHGWLELMKRVSNNDKDLHENVRNAVIEILNNPTRERI